ncbi:MAG: PD-(D/E)XK nuclease family protein [bacterium]|nr:PD-(D/E)XK nuclease family protein [bacterium]
MSHNVNGTLQLLTGYFRDFECRCPALVRELQKADPFVEVWCLVPNQLTRLHLRRVLARELGQAANIRFLTMNDLTHLLAEPLLLRDGWQLLGEAAIDPLVQQIVDNLRPSLEYLGPVAASPGFRRALLRTRDDLLSHQVAPAKLMHIELRDSERGAKLRDLARLLVAIDARLTELRLYDSNRMQELALASLHHASPALPPLVLYGLYDLPPRIRTLLTACFQRASTTTAFLPYIEAMPEFAFTAPLKNWFVNHGFQHETLPVSAREPQVHFVLAPNDPRLASEVVRDILYPPTEGPDDFAVILPPSARQFASLLESRCSTAGLTPFVYQAQTLAETIAGRGLLALADLLVSDFEIDRVVRYLSAAPFSGVASGQSGEWQRMAEEARVISGESSWRHNIARLISQFEYRIEQTSERIDDDEEDDALATLRRRLVLAQGLKEFFDALSAALNSVASARTWSAAVRALWDYYSQTVTIDREFADILVQLDQASTLDVAKVTLTRAALRDFLYTTLATPGSRSGTFGKTQPLLAAREQCYGLTVATALLPGYNEGTLPHTDSQDPLLLDDDRRALNHTLKSALPLRSEWQMREDFWLAIAQSSATHSITFYASRSDQSGRPLLVSPYFISLLARHCRFDGLTGDIEQFCSSHPDCRSIPAHPLSGRLDNAINDSEFYRISLFLAQTQRSSLPPPLRANPQFMRAVEMERARFAASTFGAYDGVLMAPDVRAAVAERYGPHSTLSATSLEEYWKCPFRYAVLRELEAYAPQSVTELDPIPGHERGTLLHNILQKYHEGRPDDPIAATHYTWERLVEITDREFRKFVAQHNVGTRYTADRLRESLRDVLRTYYDEQIKPSGAWYTRRVEADFGRGNGDFPEPLELTSEDELLRLRGRIDRWDEDSAHSKIRITDYKSSKVTKDKSRSGMRRLQIALYHAFAAQRMPGASIQSEYLHLHNTSVIAQQIAIGNEAAIQAAFDLTADLRRGIFVPDPDDDDPAACKYCQAKLACGAARHSEKPLTATAISGLRTLRANETSDDSGGSDE